MNTILEDISKLALRKSLSKGFPSCELTNTRGEVITLRFDTDYYLTDLFPCIASEIEAARDHLGIGSYSKWTFSKSILDLTPQELKARIALGLITLG
jgi:hypothetical protein